MDEERCFGTLELVEGGRAFCTKRRHPDFELHRDGTTGWEWLDTGGFKNLVNGGHGVVEDQPSNERNPEPLALDPPLDRPIRRGLPPQEGATLDGDVEDAVRRLTAAIRAESDRELEVRNGWIRSLQAENAKLRKIVMDAGEVIVAAVGSIGEPREWSVKGVEGPERMAKTGYRETFLGPKRARQWQRLAQMMSDGEWHPTFNAQDASNHLQIGHGAAASLLSAAAREGKAERVSKGVYRVAR